VIDILKRMNDANLEQYLIRDSESIYDRFDLHDVVWWEP
jgi:hypothetical protein